MPEPKPLKAAKGSVLGKPREEEKVLIPEYNEGERVYISNLQGRLERAKTDRDQNHSEFDNLTYIEYWQANERGANTQIKPTQTKGETQFQSGTLRTKMMAFLSSFQGLNLQADISAFTEQEVLVNVLGNAMEDIIEKTQEIENDEEWRMLRQYEMLKHGYVFVEDIWDQRWEVEKTLTSGFYGQIEGVKWTSQKVKTRGTPKRSLLPGPAVYLGDMTKYMIEDQPYIFTVQIMDRSDAEQIYGDWERWDYVSKVKKSFTGITTDSMWQNDWRLMGGIGEEKVEVIKYQDKPNNEFQIILNGMFMLPLGFPLTAISPDGEYTIAQQNLEPIKHDFAYGKSFIFKNKNLVAILDQMMKLAVLKTWKSFMPPRLNLSDRIVSRDMFMPGVISRGILPNQVPPVDATEAQGVTAGEFNMVQEVIKFVDRNTVSQTFTGGRETGGQVTATQIIELQRQARIMMGLMILAAALLEKKLASKRLMILLEKWFEPIDTKLDQARKLLKNRYRIVSRERSIEGEGAGVRMTIPTEETFSPEEVRKTEESLKKRTGVPVRMILLNPKELKQVKLTWVVTVNPKEKRSSEMSKMMFRAMVQDAIALGLIPSPDWARERFGQVWGEDPTKMFMEAGTEVPPVAPEVALPGGGGPRVATPQVKMPAPSPEVLR